MLHPRQVRRRLDALRGRFEPVPGPGSPSVEVATDRLVRAVGRHFDEQVAMSATADRLVDALDVIPQGIVLADAQGQVVFRNRAASGFFSARHGEALVESAIGELISVAVDGRSTTRTIELYGPPRRALQLRALPLHGADGSTAAGAFLVVDDVSERHRLDAVRRDFVANISHELKTPVGALGLLAETLAEETDPAVARRLAGKMQGEAFRLARTIDDLLELSQIEANDLPYREPLPVEDVLSAAVDRIRPGAELTGVTLVVAPQPSRLDVVGDRRQLVSAVANLCDNAVKYSDAGAQVAVSAHLDGSDVCIEVSDQGIGIPAVDLERVFERFYRVDRARSRQTGGTGLGLAIVRHVVANHGGEVTVVSREGEGSTFTMRLPDASVPPPTDRAEP